MKVKKVAVTRKFNLGNYQTVDFTLEATLDEEHPKEALQHLEAQILSYFTGKPLEEIAQNIKLYRG